MKHKQTILKAFLIAVSLSLGIGLCEVGARLILNPADYLSPSMVRDKILGWSIEPNRAGFDEWGFRNRRVPSSADVVAIGDSMTYGNTATMDDAWPAVLARATGLQVYNLGLGGYGPNQYYHLLTTKALKLHPKWVICGLSLNDDFENAFSLTYKLDYWSPLRNGQPYEVDPTIWDPGPPVLAAGARNWLSSHSMMYRLIFHGPVLAILKEFVRFGELSRNDDPYTTALFVEERNIREAFRPQGVAESLNLSNAAIQEGMRITFHLLTEMDRACRQAGCRFLVVILPTKETVFSEYLEKNPRLHLYEALNRVISNERLARKQIVEFLDRARIEHVDPLSALRESIGEGIYARTTRDFHPNRNGYRIIAESVAEHLRRVAFRG